jgi:hypothetical protein
MARKVTASKKCQTAKGNKPIAKWSKAQFDTKVQLFVKRCRCPNQGPVHAGKALDLKTFSADEDRGENDLCGIPR